VAAWPRVARLEAPGARQRAPELVMYQEDLLEKEKQK
jgi:hypothetical protein